MKITSLELGDETLLLVLEERVQEQGRMVNSFLHQTRMYLICLNKQTIHRLEVEDILNSLAEELIHKDKKK